MYYTIYKITNLLTNQIYVGLHQTTNINDGYMGSGSRITNAIRKYGKENFYKEILHIFDNASDMFEMEACIVNEEFVQRDDTYNLKPGGHDTIGHYKIMSDLGKEARKTALSKLWSDEEYKRRHGNLSSKRQKEEYKNGRRPAFKGHCHTEESKKSIGMKNSLNQKGEGNSQYGTMWIYSLSEKKSKKIKKGDPIPDGWLPGRKIKF